VRIAFLTPPSLDGGPVVERVAGCGYRIYPVSNVFELTAAAMLLQQGHQVTVRDCTVGQGDEAGFRRFLRDDAAELYAVYGVKLSERTDRRALQVIREERGDIRIVFYGPAPTDTPERFALDRHAYVVRGEPEQTLARLVDRLEAGDGPCGVAGVSHMNGRLRHESPRGLIDDLDSLPFPARHLVDRQIYSNPKLGVRPVAAVVASRNCRFRCTYCVPCSLSFATELEYRRHHEGRKPPVRLRSAENVVAECRLLAEAGYKAIAFQDDNFIWGSERAKAICRGIRDLGLLWGCATRADFVDEEVIREMAASGCRYIDIGVESFDQRILDDVHKDLDARRIGPAIHTIRKHGISAKVNILLGASPLETRQTIRHNRRMVRKLKVDQVMYDICAPFPGTDLYRRAKREGWFTHGDYVATDVGFTAIVDLPHLSHLDLEQELRRANLCFFLSPRFALRHLRNFKSWSDFRDGLVALKKKLWGQGEP